MDGQSHQYQPTRSNSAAADARLGLGRQVRAAKVQELCAKIDRLEQKLHRLRLQQERLTWTLAALKRTVRIVEDADANVEREPDEEKRN